MSWHLHWTLTSSSLLTDQHTVYTTHDNNLLLSITQSWLSIPYKQTHHNHHHFLVGEHPTIKWIFMYHYSRILYVKLISLLTTAAQNVHFKLSLSLDALLSSNVFMKLLQLLYIDNELCLYSHHALLLEHALYTSYLMSLFLPRCCAVFDKESYEVATFCVMSNSFKCI